jgi:hypothetical protein
MTKYFIHAELYKDSVPSGKATTFIESENVEDEFEEIAEKILKGYNKKHTHKADDIVIVSVCRV